MAIQIIGTHGGRKVYQGGLSGQPYYADNNQPVPAFAVIEVLSEGSVSDPGVLKEFDVPPPSALQQLKDSAAMECKPPQPRDAMQRSIASQIEGEPMDTVRSTYRDLTGLEKCNLVAMKKYQQEFIDMLRIKQAEATSQDVQRCYAIAITKAEECVMWSSKGLTG